MNAVISEQTLGGSAYESADRGRCWCRGSRCNRAGAQGGQRRPLGMGGPHRSVWPGVLPGRSPGTSGCRSSRPRPVREIHCRGALSTIFTAALRFPTAVGGEGHSDRAVCAGLKRSATVIGLGEIPVIGSGNANGCDRQAGAPGVVQHEACEIAGDACWLIPKIQVKRGQCYVRWLGTDFGHEGVAGAGKEGLQGIHGGES